MQLKELFGSAIGRAGEAVSAAREKAQERLVVVSGGSGVPFKLTAFGILLAFGLGLMTGIKLDLSHFAEFRKQAAVLAAEREAKNRALQAEIDGLRADMDQAEADRAPADREFVNVLNRPGGGQCTVPVGPINLLIKESNR